MLAAAIDVFGRQGYEGASTRSLAEAAGVNLAAIPYHFGGKEGLYLATAEEIVRHVAAHLGKLLSDSSDPPLAELRHLTMGAARVFATEPEAERWARFVIREQMAPTKAFEILYNGVMKHMLNRLTALIRSCCGENLAEGTARLAALTVFGQILTFRAARSAALRHMGWSDVGADELAAIEAMLWSNVLGMLDHLSKEQP